MTMSVQSKFDRLATDNAPGQEVRQGGEALAETMRGGPLDGVPVDFSHGDVDAHEPTPGAYEMFSAGVEAGGRQAYTEYRGDRGIRVEVAARLARFTGAPVNPDEELIITPGTQGALFLALASTVARGDKVAIIRPDYFANRKIVEFLEGEIVPVEIDYLRHEKGEAGLDLGGLQAAFEAGAKVLLFSNPNNPTGVVYSRAEIEAIAALAQRFGATVIVDQLYSRLVYSGVDYTHLRALSGDSAVVTIMGPSKTESLSGYRLGVAFGTASIISRMEKLQAIVSLRAPGYNQAVLRTWFNEPEGWMADRTAQHEALRDALLARFRRVQDIAVRTPEAGSYLFLKLPRLSVSNADFVKLLRLQAGITVTIGTEFSPDCGDSIRLNFSQNHAGALAAADRLCTMIDLYREGAQ